LINAEYIKLNTDTTKLEIMTVKVRNIDMKNNEFKIQSDLTAIKIN
ncbi:15549_t:CDS:1, partial [Racocetra fulgida]